jgi:hypothetical protein
MRTWASVSSTKRIALRKEKIPRFNVTITKVMRREAGIRELSSVLTINGFAGMRRAGLGFKGCHARLRVIQ